jgi:FkbM family methyltransferase
MSKGSKQIVAAAVLLLAAAAWAGSSYKTQWRARLIYQKLAGRDNIRFLSWGELLPLMSPRGSGERFRKAIESHVVAARQGPAPCPVYWQTPMGPFWGRANEQFMLAHLVREQLISNIYQRDPVVVRKGDVVLDLGGHLGTFSRAALQRGARLVVAFEPEPTNAACFKRTFEQEIADGRVVLLEAAAWESSGSLELTTRMNDAASTVVPGMEGIDGAKGQVTVRATTIDAEVERLGLDRVDFIKMDIEGAERNAVRGGQKTITRFAPRLVLCIYHRGDDPVAVPEVVLQARPQYKSFHTLEQVYFY